MSFVALFYCSLFSVTDVTAAGEVASVNLSLNFLSGFPKAILCEDVGLLEYVRFMTIQVLILSGFSHLLHNMNGHVLHFV